LAYGDRGFIPPVIVPPIPPVLPVVPPVPIIPPVPAIPPVPVIPPVIPVGPAPFPLVPFIPPVTTTANEVPRVILRIPASVGPSVSKDSESAVKQDSRIAAVNGQAETTEQRLLEQYVQLQERNKKLLSEYNSIIRQQQKITFDQNEQWRQLLKQHNLMVDKFNDRNYINLPRVNVM
jgi:hypothetical protein